MSEIVKKITINNVLIIRLPSTKFFGGNVYRLNVDDMFGTEFAVAINNNLSVARNSELRTCLLIGCSVADILIVAYPHMASTDSITEGYTNPTYKSFIEIVDDGVAFQVEIVV